MNLAQLFPLSAFLIGSSNLTSRQILCLGDSYTSGEGVLPAQRWASQVVRALNKQQLGFSEPDFVAKNGWTADELLRGIQAERDLLSHYDLVTLQVGVNNQYRSRLVSGYERELTQLVRVAVRFAGMRPRRVIVVSIPDWGCTPFARGDARSRQLISADIDEFNAVAKSVAEGFGAYFVDVTTCSREMPNSVVADMLHPDTLAYERWASIILPVVLAALKPSEARPDYVAP